MSDDNKMFTRDELIAAIHEAAAEFNLKEKLEHITKRQDDTFKLLSVDPDSISEIRTFQANMAFLHKFRSLSEKVGATMILTIVIGATGGIATLVWNTIKSGGGK